MSFAKQLPYREGMPGPSKLWSTISDSRQGAIERIQDDSLMTLVLERLDESLIVTRHYLNWSLGDVVHAKNRKTQSSHPKASTWPQEALEQLNESLEKRGEIAVYAEAQRKLDERIKILESKGINVQDEVKKIIQLRSAVQALCFSDEYLERYRRHFINLGFKRSEKHSNNKLQDVEQEYAKYVFLVSGSPLFSFDACGSCEATALEYSINSKFRKSSWEGLQRDLDSNAFDGGEEFHYNVATLKDLSTSEYNENPKLKRCPHPSLKWGPEM